METERLSPVSLAERWRSMLSAAMLWNAGRCVAAAAGAQKKEERMMTQQQLQTVTWLEKYQQELAAETRLLEEIQKVRSRAERVTRALNFVAVQGGSGGPDQVQGGVERLCYLADLLQQRTAQSVATRLEIQQALDTVQDAKLRTLLELRYIFGLRWEDVSERMHMDSRWLRRLHHRALDAVWSAAAQAQLQSA